MDFFLVHYLYAHEARERCKMLLRGFCSHPILEPEPPLHFAASFAGLVCRTFSYLELSISREFCTWSRLQQAPEIRRLKRKACHPAHSQNIFACERGRVDPCCRGVENAGGWTFSAAG